MRVGWKSCCWVNRPLPATKGRLAETRGDYSSQLDWVRREAVEPLTGIRIRSVWAKSDEIR